jgi:uncharacterized membrane protein YfcA
MTIALILFGCLAGFVDSIAGGGGLITLPVLSHYLGNWAESIGTNKIVGTTAAATALFVYLRVSKIALEPVILFSLWISLGSFLGSLCAPHFPVPVFRILLLLTCPLILLLIWNRSMWLHTHTDHKASLVSIGISGFCCGFYDGIWGPGGGTFMLLALLFFVRLPLISALVGSKLANTISALTGLIGYGAQGYVHWKEGFLMALGVALGAFIGAKVASKQAEKIVKPILTLVVILLITRLLFQ